MSLAELRIENLRCIESAALAFSPELNLIAGENGAGKTSILEAIFLLGRGRSFRTRSSERLIRYQQPKLTVFGRTDDVPAQQAGIDLFWGCNDESIISITAALHAAYSCSNTKYLDLDGSFDLSKDIVQGGFILKDGYMHTTGLPGLGYSKI